MKMKYILFFSVLLLFTACEEYLDVMPDSRTELDTDEKITNLLVSGYPDNLFTLTTEMSSDNVDMKLNGRTSLDIVQDQLFFWEDVQENSTNDSPEDYWVAAYGAIAVANHALQAIEKQGNQSRLNPQRGEALLIRAWNHFNLVNVFAKTYTKSTAENDLGIPYADKPETTVNPAYERASVAEVYRRIEADLTEGLALVDDNLYAVPKYHFNRKAAFAFAARFYLFYCEYDKVIAAADQVLGVKPETMLRNMAEYRTISSDFQLKARYYTEMKHNANLLITAAMSNTCNVFGNYSTGKKYIHSRVISTNESTQAAGPWGIYTATVFYMSPSSYNDGYVASPKLPYYFEYTDPVARTGYTHTMFVSLTTDETLLCRAEAYIMKKDYDNATKDLALWVNNHITTGITLTRPLINDFYSNIDYYQPLSPTVKKELNPVNFTVEKNTEFENYLQCLLHIRRIETIHEGLRWFDINRFGIVIYRRLLDANDMIQELDKLELNDPRRAIQLPASVINAGLKPNPR